MRVLIPNPYDLESNPRRRRRRGRMPAGLARYWAGRRHRKNPSRGRRRRSHSRRRTRRNPTRSHRRRKSHSRRRSYRRNPFRIPGLGGMGPGVSQAVGMLAGVIGVQFVAAIATKYAQPFLAKLNLNPAWTNTLMTAVTAFGGSMLLKKVGGGKYANTFRNAGLFWTLWSIPGIPSGYQLASKTGLGDFRLRSSMPRGALAGGGGLRGYLPYNNTAPAFEASYP